MLLQAPYYDSEDYSDANVPQTARGVSARVVARRNPDSDRIEFAIEPKLDASQLPNSDVAAYGSPLIGQRRFWSDGITHNRWLYCSPLQFTRVWSNAGTLEAEPTLEDDGSVSGNPSSGASPVTETAAGCLEAIALNSEAMVSEGCASVLATYCVDHQEVEYCREHYPPEEEEEEPASTPVMPETATSTSANRCLEIIVAGGDQSTLPDDCAATLAQYCTQYSEHAWCASEDEDGEQAPETPQYSSAQLQCISAIQPETPAMMGEECTELLRTYCGDHMDNRWCRQEFGSDVDEEEEETEEETSAPQYTSAELRCIADIGSTNTVSESCEVLQQSYCAENPQHAGCQPAAGGGTGSTTTSTDGSPDDASLDPISQERCIELIGPESTEQVPTACGPLLVEFCAEHPTNAWCRRQQEEEGDS